MNAKSTIKRIVFIAVWLCIGGGMVTLLLAAIGNRNKGVCSDYAITFGEKTPAVFMQEKDVEALLTKLAGGKIRNREISSFNLFELENKLEDNSWIDDAELWFDNKEVLHVRVTEKRPVARLFTNTGESFYVDRAGKKIPLSENHSARLPVFTGFPKGDNLTADEKALLFQVAEMGTLIYESPFWMAQVAQVDITPSRTFEMIPLLGTHVVRLGNGKEIEQKFKRLMIFYQQVLSKKGFAGYQVIDVQYKGQVVASKADATQKIDAARYKKHIEKLISESHEEIIPIPGRYELQADSADNATPELNEMEKRNKPVQTVTNKTTNPNPVKSSNSSAPADVKKNDKPKKEEADKKRVPKAVMPKRTEPAEEENGGYN